MASTIKTKFYYSFWCHADFRSKEKDGIIVCGPQFDMELIPHIVALSKKLNVPILADPLSQLRAGKHERDTIVDGYDAIFREQQWRQQLKPSFIIRFGAMPTSDRKKKTGLLFVDHSLIWN